jgi:hypothetical protein
VDGNERSKVVPLARANRASAKRLGYIGRVPTSQPRDSDSWFTPPEYLDSVRAVLGEIELDPFTSVAANKIVRATRIFTLEHSAFDQEWQRTKPVRVFMNPPYSSGLCARAVNRFIDQLTLGHIEEGIVLVNNATDTRWFNALVGRCTALCFTHHRISFWNADMKHVSGNTRGQAFFYFGKRSKEFAGIFRKHGFVLKPQR